MHPICTIYYRDDVKPDTNEFFELPTSEKIIRDTFKIEDGKYFGIFEGAGLVKHVNPTDRVDVDQLEGGKEYRIRWVVKRDTTKDSTPTTTPDQEREIALCDKDKTARIHYRDSVCTFSLPVNFEDVAKRFELKRSKFTYELLLDRTNWSPVGTWASVKAGGNYRIYLS